VKCQISRFSAASLRRYQTCPRQFFYTDVERVRFDRSLTPSLVEGNAIHAALERFYGLPIGARTLDNLHRALRAVWRSQRGEAFPTKEMEAECGRSALAKLSLYAEHFDLTETPLRREQWLSAPLPDMGAKVVGKVDRIDGSQAGGITIVDYKTGRRMLRADELANDIAARVYVLLCRAEFNRPVERVIYRYVARGVDVEWAPSEGQASAIADELPRLAWQAATDSEFRPKPGRQCDWCPHTLRCPASSTGVAVDDLVVPPDVGAMF
jgi:putative RecB family exonuclease